MADHQANLPSTLESLAKARVLVKQFVKEHGFSDSEVFDIVVALGEACTNVVLHAPTDKGFWVACSFSDGTLTIKVRDFGSGFPWEGFEHYERPRLVESGGLGIYIMRVLMDEVTYDFAEDGTTVSLVKQS